MIKSVKFGLIEFLNLLVGVSRMIKSAFFSQSSDENDLDLRKGDK